MAEFRKGLTALNWKEGCLEARDEERKMTDVPSYSDCIRNLEPEWFVICKSRFYRMLDPLCHREFTD